MLVKWLVVDSRDHVVLGAREITPVLAFLRPAEEASNGRARIWLVSIVYFCDIFQALIDRSSDLLANSIFKHSSAS